MQYRDNALPPDYRVFSVKFSVFHCRTTSSTQKKLEKDFTGQKGTLWETVQDYKDGSRLQFESNLTTQSKLLFCSNSKLNL